MLYQCLLSSLSPSSPSAQAAPGQTFSNFGLDIGTCHQGNPLLSCLRNKTPIFLGKAVPRKFYKAKPGIRGALPSVVQDLISDACLTLSWTEIWTRTESFKIISRKCLTRYHCFMEHNPEIPELFCVCPCKMQNTLCVVF